MKALAVIVFCLFSAAAFAQKDDEKLRKQMDEIRKSIERQKRINAGALSSSGLAFQPVPKNFTGVYRLKDGMPCIVPNTKNVVAIPNAYSHPKVPFKTRIPNAAPLKPLVPQPFNNGK